jgi:seryl-tRNA synthetase
MTKREFKRIGINKDKIQKLKSEYKELSNISQAKGQQITDMPHASGCSDKVCDYVMKKVDLKQSIDKLESDNRKLIKKADKFIKRIPDITIRQVLEYTYIVGLDDWDIHRLIGVHHKDVNRIINTFFLDSLLYLL